MRNLTQKSTALRLARFGTLLALMGGADRLSNHAGHDGDP